MTYTRYSSPMEMLKYTPMADVPLFVKQLLKGQADDISWNTWLHKIKNDMSYKDYMKTINAKVKSYEAANQPSEVKAAQEKEALDFASNYIQFATSEGGG